MESGQMRGGSYARIWPLPMLALQTRIHGKTWRAPQDRRPAACVTLRSRRVERRATTHGRRRPWNKVTMMDRHRGAEFWAPRPLPHHPACGSAPGGSTG